MTKAKKQVSISHHSFLNRVAKTIASHKRQIVGVNHTRTKPAFAYTIGNQEKRLPELLLIGNFQPSMVEVILNRLSDLMLKDKKAFKHGEIINLGGSSSIQAWDTEPGVKAEYTFQAGQFYNNEDYHVQQIVVQDPNGRWPGDHLCHKKYRVPVLKLDKTKANGGILTDTPQ